MVSHEISPFRIVCNNIPFPITSACRVVPKNQYHVCTPSHLYCGQDTNEVQCRHKVCPPLPGLGIKRSVLAGDGAIIHCPFGYVATQETLLCSARGWPSYDHICIKVRPPAYHRKVERCIKGKKRVVITMTDRGFPPAKDVPSSVSHIHCKPKCCENKGPYSSHLSPDRVSCTCVFHHLGFRLDSDHDDYCCHPPSQSWLRSTHHAKWTDGHLFPSWTRATPCAISNSSCLLKQCLVDSRGCLGFNSSHYFLREGYYPVQHRVSAYVIKYL